MNEIKRYEVNEEWAHSGIVQAGDYCFLNYCVRNIDSPIEQQVREAFDVMEERLALVGLARLTGESRFRALAGRQLNWLAGQAGDYPSEQCFALLAMAEALYPGLELVCVSAGEVPDWLAGVGEAYHLTALAKTADKARGLARVAPYTADYPIPAEGIRLYLCREGACQAPADTLEGLRRLLADRVYALS